ncbi:unnamed protein product, partial [Prorocentrum cordatum]
ATAPPPPGAPGPGTPVAMAAPRIPIGGCPTPRATGAALASPSIPPWQDTPAHMKVDTLRSPAVPAGSPAVA